MKKKPNAKLRNSLISLVAIIILLCLILATTLFYQNNITSNVVKEIPANLPAIKEVDDVKELIQLNEGWYQIQNGFVYYLETFDSSVPLYIKVLSPEQQNGLFVVDKDGSFRFDKDFEGLVEKENVENKNQANGNQVISQNGITGNVVGLESVSGFVISSVCYQKNKDGLQIKVDCAPLTKDYTKITTREDGVVIKEVYGEDPNNPDQYWAPKKDPTNFRSFKTESPPPAPPTSPSVTKPTPPPPDPDKIPVGKEPVLASDGYYYIRDPDGSLKWYNELQNKWYYETYTFQVTLKFSDGQTKTTFMDGTSITDVKKQLPSGVSLISYVKQSEGTLKNIGEYRVETIGDVKFVTNDVKTIPVPQGKDAEQFANDLNEKSKISQAYNDWLKSQNLQDNLVNRKRFNDHPPSDVNKGLIDEVLQITVAQKESSKEPSPIKIQLPDGTYLFVYKGKEYSGDSTNLPPQLQQIINFEKAHPNAVLQIGLETKDDGQAIYKDPSGKFFKTDGTPVEDNTKLVQTSFFGKDKTINTQIVYNYANGEIDKTKPIEAYINGVSVPVQYYNQLQGYLKAAGDSPKVNGDFSEGSHLQIIDSKGNAVAEAWKSSSGDSIIQSNFQKGQPLLTTITSPSGSVITEEKEWKETKDTNGKTVSTDLVTKSWVKIEKVQVSVDKEITLRTERVYEVDKDGKQISGSFTEIQRDASTFEPWKATIYIGGTPKYEIDYNIAGTYGSASYVVTDLVKGGPPLTDEQLKALPKEDLEKINGATRLHTQYSFQTFFADVERVFTEFQGLGYYSTLFFDEDSLLKWRDNVDRAFATLYLGTEYWSSAICGNYINGEDEGIAYAETPQGLAQVAAHVEATRSVPIQNSTGRTFIYKITFNVRNGDFEKDLRAPEAMNVNVVLKGDRTVRLFRQDQNIKRGSTFGRAGRDAIAKESTVFYKEICLTFDKTPLRWKISGNELCNKIQESSGAPTQIGASSGATSSSGSTGTNNINDI